MKIYEPDKNGNLIVTNSKRIRYAVDGKGEVSEEYEVLTEYANIVAGNVFDHFEERKDGARERVRKKKSSPIEYFMYHSNIEIDLVTALTGFSRREVKNHMKPRVFEKLDDAVLQRYAEVFETDVDTIRDFKG